MRDRYPVTIVKDRYGGAYSGATWTAWYCEPDVVPEAIANDDVSCMAFWGDCEYEKIGRGDTPQEAYDDLINRLGGEDGED